jgi:recombination protein RecA
LKNNPEIADEIELAIRENSGLIAERILDPGEVEETELEG